MSPPRLAGLACIDSGGPRWRLVLLLLLLLLLLLPQSPGTPSQHHHHCAAFIELIQGLHHHHRYHVKTESMADLCGILPSSSAWGTRTSFVLGSQSKAAELDRGSGQIEA